MSLPFKRIHWLMIWFSLLALAISLGAFALNQAAYAGADDQCAWKVERGRVLIQEVLPGGAADQAGIRAGDTLVAIQGKRVTPRNFASMAHGLNDRSAGAVLIYRIQRGDRTLFFSVRLVKPFNGTDLVVLLTGLASWAIGLLVMVSSPQRKVARHFFYLGLLALLLPFVLRQQDMGNTPLPVAVVSTLLAGLVLSLAPPLWLHFFLRFPHPFPLRTHRRFLVWLYGGFLAMGVVATMDSLLRLFARSETLRSLSGILGDLLRFADSQSFSWGFHMLVVLAALAGLVLFWVGSLRLPERRRKGLYPALILATATLLDLSVYTFLNLGDSGQSLQFYRDSWIFLVPLPLLPLSFAYAIFRHGLFDIRRAFLRWLSYFGVLGFVLAGYFWLLSWVYAKSLQVMSPQWAGVAVGLSVIPVGWLLRWLMLVIRRKFLRDFDTAREVILGNLRATQKSFSEEVLLDSLVGSLREAFRPHLLKVLPMADGAVPLPPVQEEPAEDGLPVNTQMLRLPAWLRRQVRETRERVIGLGSDEADWIRAQGKLVRARVDILEAQVMVLLVVGGEPRWAVILGGKYAELNYGKEDRELLREVALAASMLLETALMHRRVLDQGRIEQELQTARKIQEGLVTTVPPEIPGFQMALRMEPALETGGDLLWVRRMPSGKWLAAVGDVSGKGLASALYMSQATALLDFAAEQEGMGFERLLPALDQTLRNLMGRKDFLTLCLLEWDLEGNYRMVRAGHPPPLWLAGLEDAQELDGQGRGLGLRPAFPGNWHVREGQMLPGQWMVLYSDGLTEAMDEGGEIYGLPRMQRLLLDHWSQGSVGAACQAVFRDVAAFETQNRDDRTLFILGRL